MVIYHLVRNVVQYVKLPDIHHKILGLDESEINEDYYKYLLEKNTADEMRIRSLLSEKELVEETLQVLENMDPAD